MRSVVGGDLQTIWYEGYLIDYYEEDIPDTWTGFFGPKKGTARRHGLRVVNRDENRLDELLSFRAKEKPDQVQFALLDEDLEIEESLTFKQAHDWACQVAGLLDRFVSQRERVLLCFENGMAAIAGFFGCVYANVIPVSGVYPTMVGSVDRLYEILEDSEAVAVLGLRETLMMFRRQAAGRARKVKWIPIEGAENATPLYRRHSAGENDTAFVQYTSGSVGRPRGVEITHRNLGFNLNLLIVRSEFWKGRLGLTWLPLSHDMGLVGGLLFGVATGGAAWLMKPEHFIARPERWVQAIDRYRVSFSAGPNFAYELLARHVPDSALEGLDLSCWMWSVIGAEMIEQGTVERFFERYVPLGINEALLRPGYGMAEVTLMITSGGWDGKEVVSFRTFSRSGLAEGRAEPPRNEHDRRVLADCGTAIHEHALLIVDAETGQPLPEGQVGELWLSGPSVAPGYLNREQENRERFSLELAGERWFRSRDMGFVQGGRLFVTGRMENSLLIGEQRYDPDDLAQTIRQACPVFTSRSVAVFHHEGGLCAMGELSLQQSQNTPDHQELLEDMAKAMGRACPVRQLHCVLVRQGGVCRTPSGKIRLTATSEALMAGRLPVVEERSFGPDELERIEILALGDTPL